MASYNTFDPAYNGIYKVLFFDKNLKHASKLKKYWF